MMLTVRCLSILCGCLAAVPACPCQTQLGDRLCLELPDIGRDGHAAAGWSTWAEREEIKPRCFFDATHSRTKSAALAISGDGIPAEHGGWAYLIKGVRPAQYYRLTAFYQARSVSDESRQIVARIDWLDDKGQRVGQPDYAYETAADGEWTRTALAVPAPPNAACAKIELSLGWAPQGTVWWNDITFEETVPPPARWVRIGTVCMHLRTNPDNLGAYLRAIDGIAKDRPDIVCLGEEIILAGTTKGYAGAAEEIPGPSTHRLGESARKYGMYIVAGLTERAGHAIYNTAVLIDRHGNLAGKYRKVFLPREEIEGGIAPGDSYPVFDTDFGRIGIMLCWDDEYVDPARALAIQGAEILFLPTAGGYLTLFKATAMQNHVYFVSSGGGVESAIIDPTGKVLFATNESGAIKTIAVNLADRFVDPWLGDLRARFHKEVHGGMALPRPLDK